MVHVQFRFPALVGCCWPLRSLTHRSFPWVNLAAQVCDTNQIHYNANLWTTRLLAAAAWDGDFGY